MSITASSRRIAPARSCRWLLPPDTDSFAAEINQRKRCYNVASLLILKLTVTPVLVAGMSLAARRFGPMFGGLIMGLPWMTGPVLFFLALEKGDVYLAETARGALLAVPSFGAYALAYAAVARFSGWPLSLAAAALTFAISGWFMSSMPGSASTVALAGIAALIGAHVAIPKPPLFKVTLGLPWWDIPMRMLATAALVGCIALSSDYLGPTRSGIASSYPVILTVVVTFTHKRWGRDAATAMLRGVMLSLIGFVAFFWVVSTFAAALGLVQAYLLAAAAGVGFSAMLLALNSWRRRSAARKVQPAQ